MPGALACQEHWLAASCIGVPVDVPVDVSVGMSGVPTQDSHVMSRIALFLSFRRIYLLLVAAAGVLPWQ